MPKKYHIRDLEEITGIKAHTIRMWEKRYNLIEPDRSETNIRYYDESTFKKFLLIIKLYRSGMKISEISKLSSSQIQEKVLFLQPPHIDFETWVSDLLLCLTNFDNYTFEKIINESIFSFSLDRTITDFLIPFIHKIDTLWRGESITDAQKQFAFDYLKKHLYNISYAITKNYPRGENRILLFSDNDEVNYFIMLYADICLRKRNYDILFLSGITNIQQFFEHFENFNVERIIAVAPVSQDRLDKLVHYIKITPEKSFFVIDLNYVLDIDFPNLLLINNLEELENEI